ncbi:unnamed protein product [Caenorhabditis brenneri]
MVHRPGQSITRPLPEDPLPCLGDDYRQVHYQQNCLMLLSEFWFFDHVNIWRNGITTWTGLLLLPEF